MKITNKFTQFLTSYGFKDKASLSILKRKRFARLKPIRKNERSYEAALLSIVRSWKVLFLREVEPKLRSLIASAQAARPRSDSEIILDSWTDDLAALMASFEVTLKGGLENTPKIESVARRTAEGVNKENMGQWQEAMKSIMGVPLFTSEPWLAGHLINFVSLNTNLVTKLQGDLKADIQSTIESGIAQGKRVETIRDEILGTKLERGVFNKVETRATLIARDQVNKLNGQLSELRQGEIGIEYYIWHTSIDERVRQSHKVMEGMMCRWDDSGVYSTDNGKTWQDRGGIGGVALHPGQDYQCRCWAEPYLVDLINSLIGEEGEEPAPLPLPIAPLPPPVVPLPLPPPPVVPFPSPIITYVRRGLPVAPFPVAPSLKKLYKEKIGQFFRIVEKDKEKRKALHILAKKLVAEFKAINYTIPVKFERINLLLADSKTLGRDTSADYTRSLKRIRILDQSSLQDAFSSLLHEYGHYIDDSLSTIRGTYFTSLKAYKDTGLNKAIKESNKHVRLTRSLEHRMKNPNFKIREASTKHLKYLLREEELFARSFNQVTLREIEEKAQAGASQILHQNVYQGWETTDDLASVKTAVNNFLKEKGLLIK